MLIIELAGALKCFNAANRTVVTLGTVPVTQYAEVGMMGFAVGSQDGPSRPVYLFHCPKTDADYVQQLVEYRMDQKGTIDLGAGMTLLDIPIDVVGAIHMGGVIDVFEWAIGNVVRLPNHSHARIRDVDLTGIDRVRIRLAPQKTVPMLLHLQAGSPDGPLIGSMPILPGTIGHEVFAETTLPIVGPGGLHELVLRFTSDDPAVQDLLDIHWIEFLPREKPAPPATCC